AVGPLSVNTHVVVQQRVHADIAETDLLLDQRELLLPVGAQSFVSAAGTDAFLPDGAMRTADPRKVDRDRALRLRENDAVNAEHNANNRDQKGRAPERGHEVTFCRIAQVTFEGT